MILFEISEKNQKSSSEDSVRDYETLRRATLYESGLAEIIHPVK